MFQKPVRGHLEDGRNAVVSGSPRSFKRENQYGIEEVCNISFLLLQSLYQLEVPEVMQTVIHPIQGSHLALLIVWMRRDTNLWSCWPTLIAIEVVKNMSSYTEKLYLGIDEHPLFPSEFQYYHIQKARNEAALCPETTHQEKAIGDLPTRVNGPSMLRKGLQECAKAYVFQVRVAASEEKRDLMP